MGIGTCMILQFIADNRKTSMQHILFFRRSPWPNFEFDKDKGRTAYVDPYYTSVELANKLLARKNKMTIKKNVKR